VPVRCMQEQVFEMRLWNKWIMAAAMVGLAASVSVLTPARASDELTIVPFGQVGYWQILSIHEPNGKLDHCMATVEYGSGRRISFNAHASGGWGFQIHDPDWPARELPGLKSSLTVNDVRLVDVPTAFIGRSLFLELNEEQLSHVKLGVGLLVDTPYEIISLQLHKPTAAANAAANCLAKAQQ
jgi:hypothetical protein